MDQLLERARSIYEGEIDFEGQRLAEYITYGLLTFVGALAFLVGFFTQDIYQIIYIGLAGTALTFLAVVPPWPYFNKHPLAWLPPRSGHGSLQAFDIQVDGKKVS